MPVVRIEEVRRFLEESFKAVGTPETEAVAQSDLLLQADLAGHFSHGLNRLEFYVNDIKTAASDAAAKPVILKETVSTAWVDGCNALGATVGNFCMDLAIRKAKDAGVGWVCAKRSNHFGMAGYWAMKAKEKGLIGMAFTNASPLLVPTRAKEAALGTNPIGMAAPAKEGDALLVDMATTTVAMGKIEMQIHKGEPLPEGWALGPNGEPTNDPKLAFATARLTPLGGSEKTSGYKGYCLSAMVETFCSGLGGTTPTHKTRFWSSKGESVPMNLGQCFVAINPVCFAPSFEEHISECLQHYRNMEPVDPSLPVLAPGDKERMSKEETNKRGTIVYPPKQIESCAALAQRIGVKQLQTL